MSKTRDLWIRCGYTPLRSNFSSGHEEGSSHQSSELWAKLFHYYRWPRFAFALVPLLCSLSKYKSPIQSNKHGASALTGKKVGDTVM